MTDSHQITLKSFLQLLTSSNITVSRAMAIAGKIYKQCNTPDQLGLLTEPRLISLGITDKDDRKGILDAVIKAGYRAQAVMAAKEKEGEKRRAEQVKAKTKEGQKLSDGLPSPLKAGESSQVCMLTPSRLTPASPLKKKRKRDPDVNEFLPDGPVEDGAELGTLDFDELLDEEALRSKFAVVNRAPIMMAWSFVVAEHIGFQREEALSIASVYTELNAISKGVSLGIYDKRKQKNIEASPTGAQPYVELMGRRIPLYQTASESWRAFSPESSSPAPPAAAFAYISRALKQTAPAIVGAMRLLASSYTPEELNKMGWSFYADFRPDVDGWGKRGQVKCQSILALRKKGDGAERKVKSEESVQTVKYEETTNGDQPEAKKPRQDPPEEASLDEDDLFDDLPDDLSALP
ncbi:hypothetical protein OF83DRAFT_1253700 [Amylostereum chailletii]|nr:hypothetical protein OF83DRAFT_1253700 [Amylostereum chailletii]